MGWPITVVGSAVNGVVYTKVGSTPTAPRLLEAMFTK